jgi:ribosomal protein L37AE/L43A
MNYWLLLEKSDETRVSQGIDGYEDKTGREYRYDSRVPNYRNLSIGDRVLIRKEALIVGAGVIGSIEESDSAKTYRRCPACNKTDVRYRKTRNPKWKCGKCGAEFSTPIETIESVKAYYAQIERYTLFERAPDVKSVKECSSTKDGIKSQLSILRLDPKRLLSLPGIPSAEIFDEYPGQSKDAELIGALEASISGGRQGFNLTGPERKAVELRAMAIAHEHLKALGYRAKDTSSNHPYDFLATGNGKEIKVEVKGTTVKDAGTVLMTRNEVKLHRAEKGNTGLIIVSGIQLTDRDSDPKATGGDLKAFFPWDIDPCTVDPIAYEITLPGEKN